MIEDRYSRSFLVSGSMYHVRNFVRIRLELFEVSNALSCKCHGRALFTTGRQRRPAANRSPVTSLMFPRLFPHSLAAQSVINMAVALPGPASVWPLIDCTAIARCRRRRWTPVHPPTDSQADRNARRQFNKHSIWLLFRDKTDRFCQFSAVIGRTHPGRCSATMFLPCSQRTTR